MFSVHGVGRIVRKPVSFSNEDGSKTRCLFTVACNEKGKGYERADFYDCICWGGLAEAVQAWGDKGRHVYIEEAKLTTFVPEKEEGEDFSKKYEVRVDRLTFLDKKPENKSADAPAKPAETNPAEVSSIVAAVMAAMKTQPVTVSADNDEGPF